MDLPGFHKMEPGSFFMRPHFYYLAEDGETPVPVPPMGAPDFEVEFDKVARQSNAVDETGRLLWQVAFTKINRRAYVSTVFLSIDHNFRFEGPPVLWETMVFGWGHEEMYQERYTSRSEALEGHQRVVAFYMEKDAQRAQARRRRRSTG